MVSRMQEEKPSFFSLFNAKENSCSVLCAKSYRQIDLAEETSGCNPNKSQVKFMLNSSKGDNWRPAVFIRTLILP